MGSRSCQEISSAPLTPVAEIEERIIRLQSWAKVGIGGIFWSAVLLQAHLYCMFGSPTSAVPLTSLTSLVFRSRTSSICSWWRFGNWAIWLGKKVRLLYRRSSLCRFSRAMICGGSTSSPILRKSNSRRCLNKLKNEGGRLGVAALIRNLSTPIESVLRRCSSSVVIKLPGRTASFEVGAFFFLDCFLGGKGGWGWIIDISVLLDEG